MLTFKNRKIAIFFVIAIFGYGDISQHNFKTAAISFSHAHSHIFEMVYGNSYERCRLRKTTLSNMLSMFKISAYFDSKCSPKKLS